RRARRARTARLAAPPRVWGSLRRSCAGPSFRRDYVVQVPVNVKPFRKRGERWGAPLTAIVLAAGCASVPHGRRGVSSLPIRGMDRMDERSLAVCLATRERGSLAVDVSTNPAPACNAPPFDARHLRWSIFSWPWTDWPVYDRVVFERDVQRVTRWYRARGFYD